MTAPLPAPVKMCLLAECATHEHNDTWVRPTRTEQPVYLAAHGGRVAA